jgi:two-component system, response regulator PdtaR
MEFLRMLNSKILIVEDEIILANDIKQRLEKLGYIISGIVGNGKDAIKKTEESDPDLILMDVVLKGDMDGIETAQQILDLYNTPVIYLTSYYDDEILERASKTQPYGYITKPFEDIGLHTAIQMALYKHQNEQQMKEGAKFKNSPKIMKFIKKIKTEKI